MYARMARRSGAVLTVLLFAGCAPIQPGSELAKQDKSFDALRTHAVASSKPGQSTVKAAWLTQAPEQTGTFAPKSCQSGVGAAHCDAPRSGVFLSFADALKPPVQGAVDRVAGGDVATEDADKTDSLADANAFDQDAADISEFRQTGSASWYGRGFHGRHTANGDVFDMNALTAAHRTLPLSSYARVTNNVNHRTLIVKINDRGPFHSNRILDLSYAAAKMLGMAARGTQRVTVEGLSPQEARVALQQQQLTVASR